MKATSIKGYELCSPVPAAIRTTLFAELSLEESKVPSGSVTTMLSPGAKQEVNDACSHVNKLGFHNEHEFLPAGQIFHECSLILYM